ncbi:hypothetical protein Esti_003728 [Eimeria stiedai]
MHVETQETAATAAAAAAASATEDTAGGLLVADSSPLEAEGLAESQEFTEAFKGPPWGPPDPAEGRPQGLSVYFQEEEQGAEKQKPCCSHTLYLSLLSQRTKRRRSTRYNVASAGMPPTQLQQGQGLAIQEGPIQGGPLRSSLRGTPTEAAAAAGAAAAEAAAAEAAIKGSLWEQGQTPLRTLMECCSSLEEAPGGPLLRRASKGSSLSGAAAAAALTAAAFKRSSRTSSFTSVHGGMDTPALSESLGCAHRGEELDPLSSLDVQAIRYHLLPAPLMHRFEGKQAAAPSTEGASSSLSFLTQTPPPEISRGGDPPDASPVKKGEKEKGRKPKKKKRPLNKGGLKGGPENPRPASSLLPTAEFYWGPPVQGALLSQGPPEAAAAEVLSGADAETEEEEPLGLLSAVRCLEADRFTWISEAKLKLLLLGIAQGLRCLSLVGCKVGQNAQMGLNACSNLQYLNLSYCDDISSLSFLERMSGLQFLSVSGCHKAVKAENMRFLLPLKKLQELQVARCPSFDDACLGVLSFAFQGLLSFCCSACPALSAKELQEFFSNHANIISLDISLCFPEESDANLSSCLSALPDVQDLNCNGCGDIGHNVLIRLSDKCHRLRELRVSGSSSLVDESLMLLARKNCTRELELLDIRGCIQLSSASIAFLAKVSPCLSRVFLDGLPKVNLPQILQLGALYPAIQFCSSVAKPKLLGVPTYRRIDADPKKNKKSKT